jgi:hypothetical protein
MTSAPDPLLDVLGILQQAGEPLAVAQIKKAWEHSGKQRRYVDEAWPRVQKRLRHNLYVQVDGERQALTYRYVAPGPLAASDALDAILGGGLPADIRATYADLIRDALRRSSVDPEEAGRRRQARIDTLRALAELAIEVEELVANEASAAALVQRVRGRVRRSGLEPVDRAGEQTTFDRARHKPIGGRIADGAEVVVVRPGYIWKSDEGDVVLSKPVVEE